MVLQQPRPTLFPYTTLFRSVALNGEIQAAIVRHDLPLRSRDRVPLMNTLLGAVDDDDALTADTQDWVECAEWIDRKSTRLNSSHPSISYAVFCLKKKRQDTA